MKYVSTIAISDLIVGFKGFISTSAQADKLTLLPRAGRTFFWMTITRILHSCNHWMKKTSAARPFPFPTHAD